MKGTIRASIGFLVVYGAVGSLEYDPTSDILLATSLAVLGLGLLYSGVVAMNNAVNPYRL